MRQTLTLMVCSAKAQRSDGSKAHLRPRNHRHGFPQHAVEANHIPTQASVPSSRQVQFEVHPYGNLDGEHRHERRSEFGMYVWPEPPPFVRMAEEPAEDGQDCAGDLHGDVPFAPNEAQDHPQWEDHAEGGEHGEYVNP